MKKPLYKRWWFILIVIIVFLVIFGIIIDSSPEGGSQKNPETPIIINDLTDHTTSKGIDITLDATSTVTDGGNISYQWFSATTADKKGAEEIAGQTGATYTPAVDTAGTFYYYAEITNINEDETGTKTAKTTSAVSTVIVEKTPEQLAQDLTAKWVSSQFSSWDGSHIDLVKLVKENMNDPKSFKHVETKYLLLQNQEHVNLTEGKGKVGDLWIQMKFRGANAFGATILSEVYAIAERETNIIRIISSF